MSFSVASAPASGASVATVATVAQSVPATLEAQARFRIEGSGPAAGRTIVPVTEGARQLLRSSPSAAESLRGLLKVVDRAALPGAAPSINGIALSTDQQGYGVNIFAAHADDDRAWRSTFDGARASDREQLASKLLQESHTAARGSLALVTSGWMNLGSLATAAVLSPHAVEGTGSVGVADAALAVRIIRHEAEHLADQALPGWISPRAGHALQEALAEASSSSADELRATRDLLGLTDRVPDSAFADSIGVRPYPQHDRALSALLGRAGLAGPGTASVREVAEAVVGGLERSGASTADARAAVERELGGA